MLLCLQICKIGDLKSNNVNLNSVRKKYHITNMRIKHIHSTINKTKIIIKLESFESISETI